MQTVISASRRGVVSNLRLAAKNARVKIDTQHIACVFSEEAFIAHAPVANADAATAEQVKAGIDLLFLYMSVPKGRSARRKKYKIANGYYILRVAINERARRGTATFLSPSRREVFTLPVQISKARLHDIPARRSVRLSGHINWCSAGADALLKKVVVAISVKWC